MQGKEKGKLKSSSLFKTTRDPKQVVFGEQDFGIRAADGDAACGYDNFTGEFSAVAGGYTLGYVVSEMNIESSFDYVLNVHTSTGIILPPPTAKTDKLASDTYPTSSTSS